MKLSIFFSFALFIMLGIACVAPVNSSYESARTLGKGNTELMGLYTRYAYAEDGETDKSNENYGFRIGHGVTDKFDIGFQYIFLNSASNEDGTNANYLSLAFKYSLLENIIAGSLPLGAYVYDGGESASADATFFISPKLLFTYPVSDMFEASFASKIDFYFEEDYDPMLGFNLGFGLSEDLNKWAIRPETGYIFEPGESSGYWSFGVGFNYYLAGKNK